MIRVALLSDTVLDLLPKMVDERVDVETEWWVAPYGPIQDDLLFPGTALWKFKPDILFAANAFQPWKYTEHRKKAVIFGHFEWGPAIFAHTSGVYGLGVDWYLTEYLTRPEIEDPRYWYQAKMRYSPKAQELLADLYARAINAYLGKRKKALVVDLDNTLWRGILGDEGPTGIGISDDGPDLAFQDAQRAIKAYKDQGIVLAICSKNDEQLAIEALSDHPMMVLRPDDFATWRINWRDKPTNLKEIAADLNLGLDSFVFLDDSPQERELVKAALPEVTVPDLPADPSYYPRFISRLPYFDALELTDEDRKRPDMYKAEARRKQAREEATDLTEYLKSLDIHIVVRRANEYDVKRISQLTQRTNQFNLNGRKYSEAEVTPTEWWVCEASDKFGEQGLVGAMHLPKGSIALHQWVVSCRALGRGIETAFYFAVAASWPPLARAFCQTAPSSIARGFVAGVAQKTGRNDALFDWLAHELSPPTWITVEVK